MSHSAIRTFGPALIAAFILLPVCAGAKGLTAPEVLAATKPAEWRPLVPENTLYLDFTPPGGAQARVIIELNPTLAPKTVANVKAFTRAHFFDGLAFVRAQDNYVVQWGDPDGETPNKRSYGAVPSTLAPEFSIPTPKDLAITKLADGDLYAPQVGHVMSMPAAMSKKGDQTWLAHCYGMVGVGRDAAADSGVGAELYAVIGHAPRHLDRNVTLIGRVMSGMDVLSTLKRGTGKIGMYESRGEMPVIQSVRLESDVPEAERTRLEVLRDDSASFKALAEARRNNPDPFIVNPAKRIELCNVPIPVRKISAKP